MSAPSGELRRQQAGDEAVLVRRPDGTVAPQERGSGTLLAAETQRSIHQPRDEPFEPDRHLEQPAAQFGGDAVDHAGRDERLSDGHLGPPVAVPIQVRHRRGEEVVGVHKPVAPGHDPVAVGVGVGGEGDVEAVLQRHEPRHGVGRRGVHPDAAVPVHRHETERRVDDLVGDCEIQAVAVANGGPITDARATERIHAQLEARGPDRFHVQDAGQVGDVDAREVVAAHLPDGLVVGDALYARQAGAQKLIGVALNRAGHIGVRRTAVGRVVLEAAVLRRVMRRGYHDAVCQAVDPVAVVGEDGVGDRWSGRQAVRTVDQDRDAVGDEDLDGRAGRRLRQGVAVPADEERPVDPPAASVAADRLRGGQDVGLIERSVER